MGMFSEIAYEHAEKEVRKEGDNLLELFDKETQQMRSSNGFHNTDDNRDTEREKLVSMIERLARAANGS